MSLEPRVGIRRGEDLLRHRSRLRVRQPEVVFILLGPDGSRRLQLPFKTREHREWIEYI